MVSPTEYYSQIVLAQYRAVFATADAVILAQPAFSVTFDIAGELHGLQAMGQEISYHAGGVEAPDMFVILSHEDWQTSVDQGATEAMIDYMQRGKVQVVKGLRGTVTLELERSDGSIVRSITKFNGQEDPAVVLMMTTDDYSAMLRGELNGQMAFMMGRLKFEGSLPLLMAIGALAG